MKKTLITLTTTLGALAIVTTVTYAIGTLTPSGTAGDDTQYSLNDIYNRITTGATTNAGTGTMTVPTGDPSASFYTLTEIYNALPDWQTLSNSTTTVAEGFYEATDLVTVDSDLSAENIMTGSTIFGISGSAVEDDGDGVTLRSEWSDVFPGSSFSYNNSQTTCAALEQNGHSDWEVPTILELMNAEYNGVVFSAGGYYVSSDDATYRGASTTGYIYYIGVGWVRPVAKTNAYYHLRCIRG